MKRHDTFTFRVNSQERRQLEKLAARLQRSKSDAIRYLVREAVNQLESESAGGDAKGGSNGPQ